MYSLLRNYLIVLARNIVSNRLYSLLNILGLGISLSVCLTIGLFVFHELSYDRQFSNSERIYRIGHSMADYNDTGTINSSGLVATLFPERFDLIRNITRYVWSQPLVLESPGLRRIEEELAFVDENFMEMFDFNWLQGSAESALQQPDSIILTESLAREYFGENFALNQTLTLNNDETVVLRGVISDLPATTHFRFSGLLPVSNVESGSGAFGQREVNPGSWGVVVYHTYVLLDGDIVVPYLEKEIADYAASEMGEYSGKIKFDIKKLTDIHLDDDGFNNPVVGSNRTRVKIFSSIAVSILLIAIINFMNMSTAKASSRVIEVGMRMTLGASRRELIRQFLGEAIAMTALSMMLAVALTEMMVPIVNGMLDIELSLQLEKPLTVFVLLLLIALIGLLAGSYPAWYMTALRPVQALRGNGLKGGSGNLLRTSLVVLQFSISIALIMSALTIYRQMDYIRHRDKGFSSEQMLTVNLPPQEAFDPNYQWQSLKSELLSHPGISSVTHSISSPIPSATLRTLITPEGKQQAEPINLLSVEAGFLSQYRIALLAGEYFLAEDGSGPKAASDRIIINRSAARLLGWLPQEALGKTLNLVVPFSSTQDEQVLTVIGVVADTSHSARREVFPLIYYMPRHVNYSFLRGRANIRLSGTDVTGTLQYIDDIWKLHFPAEVIQRRFLDERLESQYRNENLQSQLLTSAALFAVLISCFGLFGLSSFNAERRTKEIGIRKVMGSSIWRIILQMTHDYSKPVLLANLIAWPLAWYVMQRWLESFVDHTSVSAVLFLLSSLLALLIAWLTVGSITARAAQTRPVSALRYE